VRIRGHSSSGGFTLVELLIGASLSAAVMAAVLSSYIFLGRSFARLTNQQTLETEARRTLATFAKDVQAATGISGTPSASAVTFTQPTSTGATTTVTYTFTNDAGGNGTLVRTPAGGTAQTLLRNITNNGLTISYYDTSGRAYTSFTDYLTGIRQLALEFSTQTGTRTNGTQTQVYRAASSRLLIHNSALLQ
jgi:type II secretory pathway component PulJ